MMGCTRDAGGGERERWERKGEKGDGEGENYEGEKGESERGWREKGEIREGEEKKTLLVSAPPQYDDYVYCLPWFEIATVATKSAQTKTTKKKKNLLITISVHSNFGP